MPKDAAAPLPPGLLDAFRDALGAKGCVTDPDELAPRLVDEREAFRGESPILLRPASTAEVAAAVRLCAGAGVGVVPQGGRTGLCGGTVPTGPGQVLLGLDRMNRIRDLDAGAFTITCEAGCVLADVQAAAEKADRLFPLSLAAEGSCTIGGNLATNAGGINVLRYGMARRLALGLEVVLPDGAVWDGLTSLRKDNRGYDLKQLFIGAEGTLGVITAAALEIFPRPRDIDTSFLAVPDPEASIGLFALVREEAADMVTAFELNDRAGLDMVFRHVPEVRDPFDSRHDWYVLLELASSVEGQARAAGERVLEEAIGRGLVLDGVRAESLARRRAIWALRENVSEAQKREGRSLKHDVSLPISDVPAFIREAAAAVEGVLPGARPLAFGHIGDGNVHFNVFPPEGADEGGLFAAADEITHAVFETAHRMRGSFSAEHGVGQLRRDALGRYATEGTLPMMRALKRALDPGGIMNPGKVV